MLWAFILVMCYSVNEASPVHEVVMVCVCVVVVIEVVVVVVVSERGQILVAAEGM